MEKTKFIIAIIHPDDQEELVSKLTQKDFRLTIIDGQGGFLKEKNVVVYIGVVEEKTQDVLDIIKKTCKERTQYLNPVPPTTGPGELIIQNPVAIKVGGATVFVLDADIEKI